jgi:hypothetical protein
MGEDPNRIREQIEQTRHQMSENPEADQIRSEIDDTRAQMSETVGALGQKADVKTRVKDSISDKKDAFVGKADSLVSKVTGVVPDTGQLKHGAEKVGISKQNPIGLAIGGAAVGFIAGLILPTTRIEDDKLGETSDQVTSRVKETGQEAVERGKQVAQHTLESAKETAKESGKEQGKEVASSVKETAREIAPVGGSSSTSS